MNSITVFCGSSNGNNDEFLHKAYLLGQTLAQQNIQLVYGGAKVGLMGAVADGALCQGGKVIGVIPPFFCSKEIAHDQLTELILVKNMHERKAKMNELCDAVIALPGGYGTMEELFEMLTWSQLDLHQKPIGLLNINGFYNFLILQLETMVDQGYLHESNLKTLLVSDSIEELIETMRIVKQ